VGAAAGQPPPPLGAPLTGRAENDAYLINVKLGLNLFASCQ
jgi:hypothetical protein